jgi:hypothetical protein
MKDFFESYKTLDEVKTLYRTIAKEHHPDKGGDIETMQAINSQYTLKCESIIKGSNLFTPEEADTELLNTEKYKEALQAIIFLDGLNIELVGTWIWVTGETRKHKDVLKKALFCFAPKKVAWYFRTAEYKVHNLIPMSLDEIRAKYGSEKINSKAQVNNSIPSA